MTDLPPIEPSASDAPAAPLWTPAPPAEPVVPTPPSRRRRVGLAVLSTLAAVVIVGVPAGVVLVRTLLRGSDDVISRMIPADADVYATLYLDPSLQQKMRLGDVVSRFPDLQGVDGLQRKVDQLMDTGLKSDGISFHDDVRPWLGTQVAVVAQVRDTTPTIVMVASKDDSAARATLAKVRSGHDGSGRIWSDTTYDGVTISSGRPIAGSGDPIAYAYIDHVALIGNSASLINEIVDTDRGRRGNLLTSAAFKQTMAPLPSDRLAIAYFDPASSIAKLRDSLRGSLAQSGGDDGLGQLTAYKGMGAALSAQSNGIAVDVTVRIDSSALSDTSRQALAQAAHVNTTTAFVPGDAYGFLALTGMRQGVQGLLDVATRTGGDGTRQTLDQMGLNDPNGVVAHLTGDAGLMVRSSGADDTIGGAVLVGTDEPAVTQQFLDRYGRPFLGGLVSSLTPPSSTFCDISNGLSPAAPAPPATVYPAPPHPLPQPAQSSPVMPCPGSSSSPPQPTWSVQTYRGHRISTLTPPSGTSSWLTPAYAVVDGMAVIGSSADQVRAALDAHDSGSTVRTAPTFAAVSQEVSAVNNGEMYLDVAAIDAAIRRHLSPSDLSSLDRNGGRDLDAIRGAALSTSYGPDHLSLRMIALLR